MPLTLLLPVFEALDPCEETGSSGAKIWRKHGRLHRDYDLPAVVWPDGSMFWYQRGNPYRANGKAAFIYSDGRSEVVESTRRWIMHQVLSLFKPVAD